MPIDDSPAQTGSLDWKPFALATLAALGVTFFVCLPALSALWRGTWEPMGGWGQRRLWSTPMEDSTGAWNDRLFWTVAGAGTALVALAIGQAVAAWALRRRLDAIPASISQAARLDCVSPWQRVRHVVLPACGPLLAVLALLGVAGAGGELLLRGLAQGRHAWREVGGFDLLVSLPAIFLTVWALRALVRAVTRPFARG